MTLPRELGEHRQPYQDNPAIVQDDVAVLLGRLVEEALLEGLLRLDVGVGVLAGGRAGYEAQILAMFGLSYPEASSAYHPCSPRGRREEGCSI